MRKLAIFFATGLLVTLSCNKSARPDDEDNLSDEPAAINKRSCDCNLKMSAHLSDRGVI